MISNDSQNLMESNFAIHDITKKLVTSSSALFDEEPLDIDVIFRQCKDVPRTFKSRSNPEDYHFECSSVQHYSFAWILSCPKGVDLEFGKFHISPLKKSSYSVIDAVYQNTPFREWILQSLNIDVCNNSSDAIVLGSSIYSWLVQIYSGDDFKSFIPKEGKITLKRETRSQIPNGSYEVAFFDVIVNPYDNSTIEYVPIKVTLDVETACNTNAKKGVKSQKRSDDVTQEMEI